MVRDCCCFRFAMNVCRCVLPMIAFTVVGVFLLMLVCARVCLLCVLCLIAYVVLRV